MKRIFALCAVLLLAGAVFAQQHITNFGIVDTNRVYEHFFRNSSGIKSYEKKREDFQNEINRRTDEIRDLQDKLQEAKELGLDSEAKRQENLIRSKSASLKTYTQTKQTELNNLKKSLTENNEFYKDLNRIIKKVAENEGLSMVLNLQQSNGILWYSAAVDITDKVIAELGM